LTGMVCPVIQLDAPEARNRTRLAASSGSPKRLMARARIELVTLEPDRFLYRVYDGTWGYDEFNPGLRGDSRFAPIDDPVTAKRLPSMYLGETPTTVLLETVFPRRARSRAHRLRRTLARKAFGAHPGAGRRNAGRSSRSPTGQTRPQAWSDRVEPSRALSLYTPASHRSPCPNARPATTRFIWHSRQAELGGKPAQEVVVLFGNHRYSSKRGSWTRFGPGSQNLYEGPGRLLVDQISDELRALIETGGS
jgi:hypothetical protein